MLVISNYILLHTTPLSNELQKDKSFLICLQEPPVHNGKISYLGNDHGLFYDRSGERPRAAIYASRNLHLWMLPEYTNSDMATCLWRREWETVSEVIVTSVYMDIELGNVYPPMLERLIRHCQVRKKLILICADTNAHSPLWGCVLIQTVEARSWKN